MLENFDLQSFIKSKVIERESSMFDADLKANDIGLHQNIDGKSVLVIGGAGTIGSSYIHAMLKYSPARMVVVDINENGLTELVRSLRSAVGLNIPEEFLTYPVNFSDPVFKKIFLKYGPFDIVANFAAHKHVRSEKDQFSIEAMINNNVIQAKGLLDLLTEYPPEHFFCVSTDKAANPVNVMGASKKLMEELIMSYSDKIPVTTARFANVAFSNGSLLFGFIERVFKKQPLASPLDIKRYFVSPEESGQICLMACMLGKNGEIFFPRLEKSQMKTFSKIADDFITSIGLNSYECATEDEARLRANALKKDDKNYPVYYFKSDTSGEKSFEEFHTETEEIDQQRFKSLGVIVKRDRIGLTDPEKMIHDFEELFKSSELKKSDLISLIESYVPNFGHIEKGKNLDQSM